MNEHILTLNAGSSSIKFALFAAQAAPQLTASGAIDGLGSAPRFSVHATGAEAISFDTAARDHETAIDAIVGWLDQAYPEARVIGVGHRRSIASTMGFSALEGLPMATRCGSIDPGLLLYLLDHDHMSPEALSKLLYQRSGLKGLSGDVRQLQDSDTPGAKDAIAYFAHRIRIEIAGMTLTLGGLDALVFTAGIGENSPSLRAKVLQEMHWLGLTLDEAANAQNAQQISREGALPVLVVPTDEEWMIAQHVAEAFPQ